MNRKQDDQPAVPDQDRQQQSDEKQAMERVQEEAAEERENDRGYQ